MDYATTRHAQYLDDVAEANRHYRETGDLQGYQRLNTNARERWEADTVEHYCDPATEAKLLRALATGGRVYANLNDGHIVRVHSVGNLYQVSNVTGTPVSPLIARLAGEFEVSHATIADIISKA